MALSQQPYSQSIAPDGVRSFHTSAEPSTLILLIRQMIPQIASYKTSKNSTLFKDSFWGYFLVNQSGRVFLLYGIKNDRLLLPSMQT